MGAQTGKRWWAGKIIKRFVLSASLAISVLFLILWLEHRASMTLPNPTGSFAVGREIYDWIDDQSNDPLAPTPSANRELLAWIWYPAASQATPGDYLPVSARLEEERDRGTLISTFLTRDLAKVRVHGVPGAMVSPQQVSYPVVILRAGGSLGIWNYTMLAEDLASHGYVVVGFDAPYRTSLLVFPDGRVIKRTPENNPEICLGRPAAEQERCITRVLDAWTSDTAFVLDQLDRLNTADPSRKFTHRLDMTRVGIAGHSFGGATALEFCDRDSRCKAGIDLDGAPHGAVVRQSDNIQHLPFMFLMSDHSRESSPESREIMANLNSLYGRMSADRRLWVTIRGGNHFLFSDDGALLKSHVVRGVFRLVGGLRVDGDRQLAIAAYCMRVFLDSSLKGEGRLSLISSQAYPEIEVRQ